jgi:hypothetical protein
MAVNVVDELTKIFTDLFGEDGTPQEAAEFVADPEGALTDAGITDESLQGADPGALLSQAAGRADIPSETRTQLQSLGSGAGSRSAGSGSSPTTELAQQVSSVTYVTYEGDEEFRSLTENFTTFDNSTDVRFDGEFDDIDLVIDQEQDVEQTEVNADDGGVATVGDGDVNAATGEQSQVIDGDVEGVANTGDGAANVGDDGQANTGAGAVQVGDDLEDSLVNTGSVDDGSVLAGGDLNAPVVTGEVEDSIIADELDNDGILAGGDIKNDGGVLADGDVEDVVIGDGNRTAQVDGGGNDSAFNFGDGATTLNQSDLTDSALATGGDAVNISNNDDTAASVGGDAQNISNNDVEDGALAGGNATNVSDVSVDDGGALAVGGDARGENEDNDTRIEDSFNTEDNDTRTEDSFNTEDNDTEDNDTRVEVEDSFNTDDSFNSEETDVRAEDSIVGTEQGSGELEQDEPELEQAL